MHLKENCGLYTLGTFFFYFAANNFLKNKLAAEHNYNICDPFFIFKPRSICKHPSHTGRMEKMERQFKITRKK